MPPCDIVVVGASAGGLEALLRVVRGLPPRLPAALFVVLHMPAGARSMLSSILSRAGSLPAVAAGDGAAIEPGVIYVARPNNHLLVEPGRVRVLMGPRVNGVRPAIDPLFRSAAWAYGPRVAGVVLSGTLDDGTGGLFTIKRHGGVAVVQEPDDAVYTGMPASALDRVNVDYCLPASQIAPLLTQLARDGDTRRDTRRRDGALHLVGKGGEQPVSEQPVSEQPVSEHRTAGDQGQTAARGGATGRGAGGSQEPVERLPWQEDAGTPEKPDGEASGYTCPECHGSLWEMGSRNGAPVEFECRVGHRYSLEAMLAAQAREIEAAIWSAVNTLEERASILRKQATRSRAAGTVHMADRFDAQAEEAAQHSETIRRTLLTLVQATTPGPGEPSEDDGLGEARAASD